MNFDKLGMEGFQMLFLESVVALKEWIIFSLYECDDSSGSAMSNNF